MSVEAIQCVKCGAALEVGSATTTATCTYCGSMLHVTRGGSGHLMAALEDIRSDTQVIATKAALDSVQDSLLTAKNTIKQLVKSCQVEYEADLLNVAAAKKLVILLGPVLSVIVGISGSWNISAVIMVATVVLYFLLPSLMQPGRNAKDRYNERVVPIEKQISELEARKSKLKAEIDQYNR